MDNGGIKEGDYLGTPITWEVLYKKRMADIVKLQQQVNDYEIALESIYEVCNFQYESDLVVNAVLAKYKRSNE